ncbi:hypothetical protein QJS10_CPA07g00850 [Acorus calamus]|uniref:Uncharacterized protein n=1 Tax=Acorus calamus TaxID=4465 RepID=A0AAV9EFK8_ACOCL|nr:hypothetical protein QJS10_CPA07g00850 [Acorus calamus]
MAPNGEILVSTYTTTNNNNSTNTTTTTNNKKLYRPPPKMSIDGLQRAVSDLSFKLMTMEDEYSSNDLPPISEVEDARCECCGLSEECTKDYIRRVRDRSCGRYMCGLCTGAVEEEMAKNGGQKEEAIEEHMGVCVRFNKIGRPYPVLYQAEAMREMLKRSTYRSKSKSPRERGSGGGGGASKKAGAIARSTSCIPVIMKDMSGR